MASAELMRRHNARVTRDLERSLHAMLGRERDRLKAALDTAGAEIVAYAKDNAPFVDQTGTLRRSINWLVRETPTHVVAAVYAGLNAPYAAYLEQYDGHVREAADVINRRWLFEAPTNPGPRKRRKVPLSTETNLARVRRINAKILALEFKSAYWVISGAVVYWRPAVTLLIAREASAARIAGRRVAGGEA